MEAERERVSSGFTPILTTVLPFGLCVVAAFFVARFWRDARSGLPLGLLFPVAAFVVLFAYMTWSGHRLCTVWLVGDTLEVTGPVSLRIPLSQVRSLRVTALDYRGTPLFILTLDPPIGNTEKIRFIPRTDSWHSSKSHTVQQTLRTRMNAARTVLPR
jgi:hypothetical protein